MKRGKNVDELGIFNILLIGENPHAISIADNIHSKFLNGGKDVKNVCNFNILGDIESTGESKSWFNEFIFDITTASCFNNVVVSAKFRNWMFDAPPMERLYMKMLLKAMNFIIIDIAETDETVTFDENIPQYKFNVEKDFGVDLFKWIDEQLKRLNMELGAFYKGVGTLGGGNQPYVSATGGYDDPICS